ncbi:MAG: serine hydrolase domain-containing protein [Bacteroidota bacterium]
MKRLLVSLLWMGLACSLAAQSDRTAYEHLLKQFHTYVDNGELAGTVIFLEKNGILTKDVYGYADTEKQTPISENSLFRFASMTKPLTATAIMQLVEKDKLSLDDPVATYIPAVAQMRVFDGTTSGRLPERTMTIRHLLSHTSGITSRFDFSDAGKAANKKMTGLETNTLEELIDLICQTHLAFEPGEGWAYGYSNDLLAYIVEKVSGTPIDVYFDKHIFQPLDMHHTSFQTSNPDMLTSLHATRPEGGIQVVESPANSQYVTGENMPRGNTGLIGTAGDYLNFCRMILNKGTWNAKLILTPASMKVMQENVVKKKFFPIQVASNEMYGQGYGLGVGVVMEQSPFGTKGDIYWPGAYYTYFFVNPEQETIAIFMTQLFDMSRMNMIWEFHDLATKALDSFPSDGK